MQYLSMKFQAVYIGGLQNVTVTLLELLVILRRNLVTATVATAHARTVWEGKYVTDV